MRPDLDGLGNPLVALDRLASHCRERFLPGEEGHFVFISSERLDGKTGTADLVVIAARGEQVRGIGPEAREPGEAGELVQPGLATGAPGP